jgi:hypothetical protein
MASPSSTNSVSSPAAAGDKEVGPRSGEGAVKLEQSSPCNAKPVVKKASSLPTCVLPRLAEGNKINWPAAQRNERDSFSSAQSRGPIHLRPGRAPPFQQCHLQPGVMDHRIRGDHQPNLSERSDDGRASHRESGAFLRFQT